MLTKDIELLRKENEELTDKMRKAEEGMQGFFLNHYVKSVQRKSLAVYIICQVLEIIFFSYVNNPVA